jgi:hypothetical protein
MTGKVIVFYEVDSCETCHFRQREYGAQVTFRCKEDTNIVFVQNKDSGVPQNCPFRKRKLP